jgi:hypothetical protein
VQVEIRRLGPADEEAVLAVAAFFDDPSEPDATRRFLAEPTHHLFFAYDPAGRPVEFGSGVETTHPDKALSCSSTSSASAGRRAVRASAAHSSRRSRIRREARLLRQVGAHRRRQHRRPGIPTNGRALEESFSRLVLDRSFGDKPS